MAEEERQDDAEQPEQEQKPEQPEAGNDDVAEAAGVADEVEPKAEDVAGEMAEDTQPDLEQLQAALTDAEDRALRAQAEAQNTRRRADQEIEKARKFALERFCNELLPVVDNLERALEAGEPENEAIKPIYEGVELTLKSFLDVLQKFKLECVDPEGEPFDPQLHQAMSMIENPDVEPNTVLTVVQKGYTLNGRLIRPAMVMVSKSAAG